MNSGSSGPWFPIRSNIGASELTYRAGTYYVLEAVKEAGGPDLWDDDPQKLREKLCGQSPQNGIEVIVATSGKALLLVPNAEKGRNIIAAATENALKGAPGLDLCGVVSSEFDLCNSCIHKQVVKVHRLFEEVRSQRPAPEARFPMLPVCRPCASSSLPAAQWVSEHQGKDAQILPLSTVSLIKQQAAKDWRRRLSYILGQERVPDNLYQLEKDFQGLDWLAVVHADGNGLGKIFLQFQEYIEPKDSRNYICKLRRFSVDLEEATEAAFQAALQSLLPQGQSNERLPIVPVVLGGDDLTAVCDGRSALRFTRAFLKHFEEETGKRESIKAIAAKALHAPHLSACAGVAIVKPHFPFYSAYELAEQLLKKAKEVKRKVQYPCSALDFHVLYDASFSGLETIRKRLETDNGNTRLYARPYVVTGLQDLDGVNGRDWAEKQHVRGLLRRIEQLNEETETGDALLASSQVHALRTALFQGRAFADAQLSALLHRYAGLEDLLENKDSLFRKADKKADKSETQEVDKWETRLLDALDVADFWKNDSGETDE